MSAPDELEEFYVHTVTARTHAGEGGLGPIYTEPSPPLECFVAAKRQLVRNQYGDQIVSETTITAPLRHGHWFAPESLVDLGEREATVISRAGGQDSGELDLPDHIEVTLT